MLFMAEKIMEPAARGGYFSQILFWHVANLMESLTAFIPINRCPLTCPWTPPVPSNKEQLQTRSIASVQFCKQTRDMLHPASSLDACMYVMCQAVCSQAFYGGAQKYVPSDNQSRIMNKDDIYKPESKFQIPIEYQFESQGPPYSPPQLKPYLEPSSSHRDRDREPKSDQNKSSYFRVKLKRIKFGL